MSARRVILALVGLLGLTLGEPLAIPGSAQTTAAEPPVPAFSVAAWVDGTVIPIVSFCTDTAAPGRSIAFTTDEQLDTACGRINRREEPFLSAWRITHQRANEALDAPVSSACEYRHWQDDSRTADDTWKVFCGSDHKDNHESFARGHLLPQMRAARALALAYQMTGAYAYADKAIAIMDAWASQPARYPESGSGDCPPYGSAALCNHSPGLVLGMAALQLGDVYALVEEAMTAAQRNRILDMIKSWTPWILESKRVWEEQDYFYSRSSDGNPLPNINHISAHNMGLATIGYLTGDTDLKNFAISGSALVEGESNPRTFKDMIAGAILRPGDMLHQRDPTLTEGAPPPVAGEIYDRYRTIDEGKGNGYAALHFRFLAMTAEVIIANGQTNFWNWQAPSGEKLSWYFDAYEDLVSTGSVTAGTGYYTNDTSVRRAHIANYILGEMRYRGHAAIGRVFASRSRLEDDDWFGYSLLLTHGAD